MRTFDAARPLVHFYFSQHWLGMQARQSASLHHPVAFGFWLLATCAAAAACSDDGNLLGSENSAGSGGAQAGSGGTQAGTGGAQAGSAGTQAGAGTSAGGAVVAGAGGSDSEGGGSQGGDGGTSSGGASGGGDCVGETCAANETCVAHRVIGGAISPPDADNQCMAGRHLEGSYCQADFMYSCATLTGCSTPSATCRCAAGTDCAGTTVCRLPAASVWLDTDAQLVCELLAP